MLRTLFDEHKKVVQDKILPLASAKDLAAFSSVSKSWNQFFNPEFQKTISDCVHMTPEQVSEFSADVNMNPRLGEINFYPALYQRLSRYKQFENILPEPVKLYFQQNIYFLLAICLDDIDFAKLVLPFNDDVYFIYASIYAGSNKLCRFFMKRNSEGEYGAEKKGIVCGLDTDSIIIDADNRDLILHNLLSTRCPPEAFIKILDEPFKPTEQYKTKAYRIKAYLWNDDCYIRYSSKTSLFSVGESIHNSTLNGLNKSGFSERDGKCADAMSSAFQRLSLDEQFSEDLSKACRFSPQKFSQLCLMYLSQPNHLLNAHFDKIIELIDGIIRKDISSYPHHYLTHHGLSVRYALSTLRSIQANISQLIDVIENVDLKTKLTTLVNDLKTYETESIENFKKADGWNHGRTIIIEESKTAFVERFLKRILSTKEKRFFLKDKINRLVISNKAKNSMEACQKIIEEELREQGYDRHSVQCYIESIPHKIRYSPQHGRLAPLCLYSNKTLEEIVQLEFGSAIERRKVSEAASWRSSYTSGPAYIAEVKNIVTKMLEKTDYTLDDINNDPKARSIFEKSSVLKFALDEPLQDALRPKF